jgi:hypothetical protein
MRKLLGIITIILVVSSCYYDNEEDLYQFASNDCDTSNVTYSKDIAPLTQTWCNSCHSGSAPSGGVNTSNYNGLRSVALSGAFYGSITHSGSYSPMPQNSPKLSVCNIAKVRIWIEEGALNN